MKVNDIVEVYFKKLLGSSMIDCWVSARVIGVDGYSFVVIPLQRIFPNETMQLIRLEHHQMGANWR